VPGVCVPGVMRALHTVSLVHCSGLCGLGARHSSVSRNRESTPHHRGRTRCPRSRFEPIGLGARTAPATHRLVPDRDIRLGSEGHDGRQSEPTLQPAAHGGQLPQTVGRPARGTGPEPGCRDARRCFGGRYRSDSTCSVSVLGRTKSRTWSTKAASRQACDGRKASIARTH
jgi:hypothetical protein